MINTAVSEFPNFKVTATTLQPSRRRQSMTGVRFVGLVENFTNLNTGPTSRF